MRIGILIHISVLLSVFSVLLSGCLVVRRESSSVLRKQRVQTEESVTWGALWVAIDVCMAYRNVPSTENT